MSGASTGANVGGGSRPVQVPCPQTPPDTGVVVRTPAPAGAPLVDVMDGDVRREIKVLDHGFVALVDAMPRLVPPGQTADAAIVQAARVSYGQGTKKVSEDRGLIRYLLRHRHTTPFEMVEFKFHVAMPIFIARQWIRHRTASVNEYSGRYSVMPDRFYRPSLDQVRKQGAANRQGGSERFVVEGMGQQASGIEGGASTPGPVSAVPDAQPPGPSESVTAHAFIDYLRESEDLYRKYLDLTNQGVSRELARIGLPVSLYTEWYWKIDLHNLLHFLGLRMDAHAQEEIRLFATAIHDLIQPIVPVTMEAWRDYHTGGVKLTRLEVVALRDEVARLKSGGAGVAPASCAVPLPTDNKREQAEWDAKRERLGL